MTTTVPAPARNGVDTATVFATLDAVKSRAEGGAVPVPRRQRVGQRHPQLVAAAAFDGAALADRAAEAHARGSTAHSRRPLTGR